MAQHTRPPSRFSLPPSHRPPSVLPPPARSIPARQQTQPAPSRSETPQASRSAGLQCVSLPFQRMHPSPDALSLPGSSRTAHLTRSRLGHSTSCLLTVIRCRRRWRRISSRTTEEAASGRCRSPRTSVGRLQSSRAAVCYVVSRRESRLYEAQGRPVWLTAVQGRQPARLPPPPSSRPSTSTRQPFFQGAGPPPPSPSLRAAQQHQYPPPTPRKDRRVDHSRGEDRDDGFPLSGQTRQSFYR